MNLSDKINNSGLYEGANVSILDIRESIEQLTNVLYEGTYTDVRCKDMIDEILLAIFGTALIVQGKK